MKIQADTQSREGAHELLCAILRDVVKCVNEGASTVQVSMSCELAVRVEDSRGSYEPQMTNVCLSVSNIEKMSKDMVMALGATVLSFIGLLGNTGEFDYECKAL